MKRIISFALIIMMVFALAACKQPKDTAVDPTDAPKPTEAAADPTEVPTDDPAKITPEPTEMPVKPDDPHKDLPKIMQGHNVAFIYNPDGALYGWGSNEYGQVGCGSNEGRNVPVFIGTGLKPVIVGDTVFALSPDGVLWGWGRNDAAQLGTGDTENRLSPVELMYFVTDVVDQGLCFGALTESGEYYEWGWQPVVSGLTDAQKAERTEPQLVLDNVRSVNGRYIVTRDNVLLTRTYDEGWQKLCEDVAEVCWDYTGILVKGTDGKLYALRGGEKLLVAGTGSRSVTISDGTAYILMNDGKLYSYVIDFSTVVDTPEDAMGRIELIMDGVTDFYAGFYTDEDWAYDYKVALKANGELWTWGVWKQAMLGKSQMADQKTPECVATGVRSVVVNGAAMYAVADDGELWATGMGRDEGLMFGCIGDGTDATRYGFVSTRLEGVCEVYSDLNIVYEEEEESDYVILYSRSYAVDAEGRIFAWGWNGDGFLGTGAGEELVLTPTEVHLTKN
ncbi:MAG: hypothetical protein J5586_08115 [Clostridia bacterium]|nr:hypothetical protein [Clostridia bacterium]